MILDVSWCAEGEVASSDSVGLGRVGKSQGRGTCNSKLSVRKYTDNQNLQHYQGYGHNPNKKRGKKGLPSKNLSRRAN